MAQPHEQRGAYRQREQHASEAEQLAERKQREDHGQRMQTDAIANQEWDEHVVFEQLADAIDRQDREESGPARPLQQRREHAAAQAQPESYVRDKNQQA